MRTLFFAAALATAPFSVAQVGIDGVLVAPDGTPHPNALVAFESGRVGPGIADSTRTDAAGRFRLTATEGAPGALGVFVGGGSLWLPVVPSEPGVASEVRLHVSPPGDDRLSMLVDFAATSPDATLAALMEAYVEAERWHRTPMTSPALQEAEAQAQAKVEAAPQDRQDALIDSLRTALAPLYAQAQAPRVEAFSASASRTTPSVRAGYALWAVDKVVADSAHASALFDRVAPVSPLWSFEGTSRVGVSNALGRSVAALVEWGAPLPPAIEAYLTRLAYDHPDPNVRVQGADVLHSWLDASGDPGARTARVRLVSEFPDSPQAEEIRRTYAEDRRVRPGHPAPDFSFPSLADPAVAVTSADARGSTVLLDFWGTWCGPCIQTLPRLHRLYEAYHDQGFEILSVAISDTADDVAAFRRDRFPMPWRHALHPEGSTFAAGELFEFTGVPAYVLVGPDGIILAEGKGAEGEALDAALADHFGAPRD